MAVNAAAAMRRELSVGNINSAVRTVYAVCYISDVNQLQLQLHKQQHRDISRRLERSNKQFSLNNALCRAPMLNIT